MILWWCIWHLKTTNHISTQSCLFLCCWLVRHVEYVPLHEHAGLSHDNCSIKVSVEVKSWHVTLWNVTKQSHGYCKMQLFACPFCCPFIRNTTNVIQSNSLLQIQWNNLIQLIVHIHQNGLDISVYTHRFIHFIKHRFPKAQHIQYVWTV